jgi:hypothetical protein
MFLIPAATVVISLAFAVQVFNRYLSNRRSHHLAWAVALVLYAIAAVPEVVGSISGWSDIGFRVYYLAGAILLVPLLSLGTTELLIHVRSARLGYRAFVAAVSLVGIVAVALASLHAAHLVTTHPPDNCTMYCPSEHGYAAFNVLALVAAAIGSSIGTIVLVVGAGYSAWRTWRAGLPANLTTGNILIVVGALVVAGLSTLTRLHHYELFYAGQAVGIAIIFAGFLVIGSASVARGTRVASGAQPA